MLGGGLHADNEQFIGKEGCIFTPGLRAGNNGFVLGSADGTFEAEVLPNEVESEASMLIVPYFDRGTG